MMVKSTVLRAIKEIDLWSAVIAQDLKVHDMQKTKITMNCDDFPLTEFTRVCSRQMNFYQNIQQWCLKFVRASPRKVLKNVLKIKETPLNVNVILQKCFCNNYRTNYCSMKYLKGYLFIRMKTIFIFRNVFLSVYCM